MTHTLFDFVQVRDLGDPDSNRTRSRHVPLVLTDGESSSLKEFQNEQGNLTRRDAIAHVLSPEFGERAKVVETLFNNENGLEDNITQLEFRNAPDLMAAAYSTARIFRKDQDNDQRHLSQLIGFAGQMVGTQQMEKLENVWLADLAFLYLAPLDFIEYRRVLAGLRRLTFVLSKVKDRGFASWIDAWQNQPDDPNIVRDWMMASRIIISPELMGPDIPPSHTGVPIVGGVPTPDAGSIRAPILNQSARRRAIDLKAITPIDAKKEDRSDA